MSGAAEFEKATRRWRIPAAIAIGIGALASPAQAQTAASAPAAASPTTPAQAPRDVWKAHYDEARTLLSEGEYAAAAAAFDALTREATTDSDRELASELAKVASNLAQRAAQKVLPVETPANQPASTPSHVDTLARTSDEITILYASAFLYGIGTGAWFLLQTQPDSAATATLPFVALTAAPIIALATIDGHRPLRRSVAHSITSGLYLGLGEGLWVVAYQHARADRKDGQGPTDSRWPAEKTSSVLWGGATLGAVVGGVLGGEIATTPGRVSFAASTALWSGILGALTASAVVPESPYRAEDAALTAGISYNAGLITGIFLAGRASPSVARVRVVDLSGAAGVLAASAVYYSLAGRNTDARIGSGVAALGGAAGLTLGIVLTSAMQGDAPVTTAPTPTAVTWQPTATPTSGGGMLGIAGTF